MILVTVGTHNQGFNRLVKAMDELAAEIAEPVIIQRGISTYQPQHAEYFQFTTSQQMVQLTREARVIVTHAAGGAIITVLREGKPLVMAPRLKRFGEHVDDHQLQLAGAMAARGRAVKVLELTTHALRQAIDQAARQDTTLTETNQLVNALRRQLDEWNLTETQPKISTK